MDIYRMPAFLVLDPAFNLPIPAGFCIEGCNSFGGSHLSFLHLIARKGRHEYPVFPAYIYYFQVPEAIA
jgi:hypothetical protein